MEEIKSDNQDVILYHKPEVTFFKSNYKRHIPFKTIFAYEDFDGQLNFGEKISCLIKSRVYNLIHRMYLVIDLPEINLTRNIDNTIVQNAFIELKTAETNYRNIYAYAKIIMDACILVDTNININNPNPTIILNELTSYFFIKIDIDTFNALKLLFPADFIAFTDILGIITGIVNDNSLNNINKIDKIKIKNNSLIFYLQKQYKNYYNIFLSKQVIYQDVINKNYNFAWVKYIGHKIFEYIDIDIDGVIIDTHYNDYYDMMYNLSDKMEQVDTYNRMIGNINDLYDYNRFTKDAYKLYIPLKFWFNKFPNLSIPIVAMRNSNIKINVKMNDLKNCIITDAPEYDINIVNIRLLVEFIYVNDAMQNTIAEHSNDYIIEQTFRDIYKGKYDPSLLQSITMVHPCKEMIWYIQGDDIESEINLESNELLLENYTRFKYDGFYFRYVIPYEYHRNIPAKNIYNYSFALEPENYMSTGSQNFTRIKNPGLLHKISEKIKNTDITIIIYGKNINILKIEYGTAKVSYNL